MFSSYHASYPSSCFTASMMRFGVSSASSCSARYNFSLLSVTHTSPSSVFFWVAYCFSGLLVIFMISSRIFFIPGRTVSMYATVLFRHFRQAVTSPLNVMGTRFLIGRKLFCLSRSCPVPLPAKLLFLAADTAAEAAVAAEVAVASTTLNFASRFFNSVAMSSCI